MCPSAIYHVNTHQSSINCAVARFVTTLLIACALFAPGCSTLSGGGSTPTLTSASTRDQLALRLPTQVFTPAKAGIADIYLTDLPADALTGKQDLANLTGTIVHIHVFTIPSAGDTPIATTATTSTVRVAILANGQAGIYAGGGFFTTSEDDATGKDFDGRLRRATVYLRQATPGFDDVLGPSEFSTGTSPKRDEKQAAAIASALDAIANATQPVE